jgi:hypothetical protein
VKPYADQPFPAAEGASAKDILLLAGKTLANAAHFTQGALARDAHGKPCAPDSIRAKSWDAIGVLYGASRVKLTAPIRGVCAALAGLDLAACKLYRKTIRAVNDELGHEAVLNCLRLAYRRA